MYNGIGLTTPRGSGTSGHVMSNRSHVRADRFRERAGQNRSVNGADQSWARPSAIMGRANEELLEHTRRRKVESKIFELQEAMIDRGYSESDIEAKVAEVRRELEVRAKQNVQSTATLPNTKETHVIQAQKVVENQRMRDAFGMKNDFIEGESFDKEAQARKKQERAIEREKRKAEQLEAKLLKEKEEKKRKKDGEKREKLKMEMDGKRHDKEIKLETVKKICEPEEGEIDSKLPTDMAYFDAATSYDDMFARGDFEVVKNTNINKNIHNRREYEIKSDRYAEMSKESVEVRRSDGKHAKREDCIFSGGAREQVDHDASENTRHKSVKNQFEKDDYIQKKTNEHEEIRPVESSSRHSRTNEKIGNTNRHEQRGDVDDNHQSKIKLTKSSGRHSETSDQFSEYASKRIFDPDGKEDCVYNRRVGKQKDERSIGESLFRAQEISIGKVRSEEKEYNFEKKIERSDKLYDNIKHEGIDAYIRPQGKIGKAKKIPSEGKYLHKEISQDSGKRKKSGSDQEQKIDRSFNYDRKRICSHNSSSSSSSSNCSSSNSSSSSTSSSSSSDSSSISSGSSNSSSSSSSSSSSNSSVSSRETRKRRYSRKK